MINTSSARIAIALATAHGHQAKPWLDEPVNRLGVPDSIRAVWRGLAAGRILAAIDACPQAVREWLLLCYAAPGCAPSHCLHTVTSRLYLEQARRRTIRTTPARAANIAGAVVSDMIRRYRTPERAPATSGEYAAAAGLKPNRYDGIASLVNSMQDIVEGWDRAGVTAVAAVLPHEWSEEVA